MIDLSELRPEQFVELAKALRKTLDPWEMDDQPVGPSTRIRKQYCRSLSITELPIIRLRYLQGIPTRQEPSGWELIVPGGEGLRLFLKGKREDREALQWADEYLTQEGWVFSKP